MMDEGQGATEAKRATLLVAALIAATILVSLLFDPRDHGSETVFVVDAAHGVVALAIALWFARPAPKRVLSSELAFTLVMVPFFIGLWIPAIADLRNGTISEPLMPHHFLLLGIAILSPTRRSGVVFLAAFALHALALGYVLGTGTGVAALAHEPWMTVLFTTIAALLLYARSRRRALEQRVDAAEERVRVLADVARMLIALRDRANTPLQTMEIAVVILGEDGAATEQVEIMKRALARLASVQQMLSRTSVELAAIAGNPTVSPGDLEQTLRELVS